DKMAQYSFKKLMLYKKDKKLVIKMLLYKFRVLDIFPFLRKYVY
ncbi:glycosyl transferase, partial [Salmonella enterica subsp. enterica serovar Enteritidis]|nr:glycosyl transferase [Salmonella enterica subsp. enterica serovar Enteritidis]